MNLPEGIAGIPEKSGIASRFEAFLKKTIPPTAPNSWSKPITTC